MIYEIFGLVQPWFPGISVLPELQHPLFQCSPLTIVSFCTKGLPGVAESTVFISEGKPSPGGRGFFNGLWILRLRLRLRVEWQVGGNRGKSESFHFKETDQKWVWCFVYGSVVDAKGISFYFMLWVLAFWMMLFLLVIDWCVYCFWIDTCVEHWTKADLRV